MVAKPRSQAGAFPAEFAVVIWFSRQRRFLRLGSSPLFGVSARLASRCFSRGRLLLSEPHQREVHAVMGIVQMFGGELQRLEVAPSCGAVLSVAYKIARYHVLHGRVAGLRRTVRRHGSAAAATCWTLCDCLRPDGRWAPLAAIELGIKKAVTTLDSRRLFSPDRPTISNSRYGTEAYSTYQIKLLLARILRLVSAAFGPVAELVQDPLEQAAEPNFGSSQS